MSVATQTAQQVYEFIQLGSKLDLATQNYPSRGQTAIQELYQTTIGKIFLKRTSLQNHINCKVNLEFGSLAEREYWAYCLAAEIGLSVPALWQLDIHTTAQIWLNYPDGLQYSSSQAAMQMKVKNIFDCALFDWLSGQVDRHNANYLYNYVDNEIILIDSAHCFLKYSGSLPHYLELFEIGHKSELNQKISTSVKSAVRKLTQEKIKTLIPLRDEQEKDFLVMRFNQVKKVESIQDLIQLYRGAKR